MKLGPVAVGTVLVTLAFSGCGGSSTSSSRTTGKATTASSGTGAAAVTPPPGTPAALRGAHGGVLLAGELPGFVPAGQLKLSTSAQSAVAEDPPEQRAAEEARLKALGFIAGLNEPLVLSAGSILTGQAISLVELFRCCHSPQCQHALRLQ